jgi:molecular chaperone DnaJ
MAKKIDYYKALDLDKDASQSEVKKAYRRLARKYHPDANPGDETAAHRFHDIKEAYDVLSNPLKRDKYDQYGYAGLSGFADIDENGFGVNDVGAAGGNDVFTSEGAGDIYDISHLDDTAGAAQPQPGTDLRFDLEITFEDSVYGTETEVEIPIFIECRSCFGTGAQPGTAPRTCPVCRGTGRTVGNAMCNACAGHGKIIDRPCRQCSGSGSMQSHERILINIPPGVDEGSTIRVHGKGAPGLEGGPPGDLYVMLSVREHDIFKRHGYDILCEIPIDFIQAVFGAEIEVPTVDGPAKMRIPGGTQTGTIFRLRNKGLVNPNSGTRGSQHVKVTIVTPTDLVEREKKILMKYAMARSERKK